MMLDATTWNLDNMYGSISLACDEQLVSAKGHVHRLVANLYGNLLPE